MSDKTIFAYSALFDSPDDIIHAAEEVKKQGFEKYDVNTPYPVHGMDDAMKLSPSKLGYVALFFGLSGMLAAIILTYFTSVVDYPQVIGGKPFYAFPGYVPVMFELTVLSAAVLTVATMLLIFFKLPNNRHPLHDTNYMKAVSSDKYGLYIEIEDEKYDEAVIKSLFERFNAKVIEPIYYDDTEVEHKNRIFEPKFIIGLVLIAVITSGTTYFTLNKLMFMIPFSWMMDQDKIVPQESYELFADGFGMRNPVEGTIARGQLPYEYYQKPEEAAVALINPLFPTAENFALGKKKYDIYCSPCHGYHGEGDSRMRGQFPNPPSLHSEKVRDWTDGRIYHVITEGQNVMPSYSTQLSREEKWATVLYIRALQRSLNAKESDLE
ncbi:MAG: DUF3341 domain-containing protein [Melioribacteraceae bacterium]|nr:DUF3341 domain-containing protein [Melioribacteraceae bacterium]MCF8264017.1 DUF3341 domain-containing protein [Melioribacteraceae bacterium]MCF8431780.1 DUF3341 domain-containing protein [Melioribacteraceae bacterium]